jgi:hypothetical protein
MEWCEARLDTCVIGGLGATTWERAAGCVLLSGYSNVCMRDCVVQHSGSLADKEFPGTVGFGVQCVKVGAQLCVWLRRCRNRTRAAVLTAGASQDAHCHVVGCTVRDNGIGIAVRDNASAVVASSALLDNRECALFAPDDIGLEEEGLLDKADTYDDEDDDDEEQDVPDRPRGCLVLAGSWTNTVTWYDRGRPTYLNNYLFEVGPVFPRSCTCLVCDIVHTLRMPFAISFIC